MATYVNLWIQRDINQIWLLLDYVDSPEILHVANLISLHVEYRDDKLRAYIDPRWHVIMCVGVIRFIADEYI